MSYPEQRMITCLLSSELMHLDIGIAALSEVRRPDCGEIMEGGYTYYWSGRCDCYHAKGVVVAVSNKLTPMVIEVTLLNERIMRPWIRHSLGVVSLVSVRGVFKKYPTFVHKKYSYPDTTN